jgi:hypothetical protein
MAYSAKPVGDFLQIFNALTGSPHFSIHIGSRGLHSYFMSGNTLTITYKAGNLTEVWDLTKRQKLR